MDENQAKQIKEQLIQQIRSWNTDEEQKQETIDKIEAMSEKELEEFLIKNNMIKDETSKSEKQECVFCLILAGKIPSYKLSENKDNIAILEINPLSKGHSLIVPKKHMPLENLPVSSFSLAKKLAKKIKEKLNPKEVKISSISIFNHALIEVVPMYGNETGERKKATEAELKELQSSIEIKVSPSKPRQKKPKKEGKEPKRPSLPYAPRRIP